MKRGGDVSLVVWGGEEKRRGKRLVVAVRCVCVRNKKI